MRSSLLTTALLALSWATLLGQSGPSVPPPPPIADVTTLVSRLNLDSYKATIKALTQFGDRRQGTERNRKAVDWIEAQLKSYGCPTERIKYEYNPPPQNTQGGGGGGGRGGQAAPGAIQRAQGGGRLRGNRAATGVNTDAMKQPDEKLRALNMEPTTPGAREEVYCTKVGSTTPNEMYIVAGHMDGHGWGEAANDNGSGTALVMELARIFSMPDVVTERTIRFALMEQRRDRPQWRARLRRTAAGAAGKGRIHPGRAVIQSRGGWAWFSTT